jgi:hypothetical protein
VNESLQLKKKESKEKWDRKVDQANRLYRFTTLFAGCLLITGTIAVCTGQRKTTEERLN